jgi:uncharacterized paraquat-inducible protein A
MNEPHVLMLVALLAVSAGAVYWIISTVVDVIIWIVDQIRTYSERRRQCVHCGLIHRRARCLRCGSYKYEYL